MEPNPEHKSVRDPNWHPRQQSEAINPIIKAEIGLNVAFRFPPGRIAELVKDEGLTKENLSEATADKLDHYLE